VLLLKGAKVYIASPLTDRIQAMMDDLREETRKESVFFLDLDLGDLDSIKTAAEEFLKQESQLHALYNNAYVLAVLSRTSTLTR
jgi:retinol dehydrogenase-12